MYRRLKPAACAAGGLALGFQKPSSVAKQPPGTAGPHEKPGQPGPPEGVRPNQIGVRTLCRSHLPVLPAYPILRAYVPPYARARAHSPAANPHDRRSIHADALRPLAGAVIGCHNAPGVSSNAPLGWRVGYADPIRLSLQGANFLGDSL